MGRKQKLRQERKIKNKNQTSAVVVTTTAEATVEAASEGRLPEAAMTALVEELDDMFPKSDECVQATMDTQIINGNEYYKLNNIEQYVLVKQGAIEHGCVHSMLIIDTTLRKRSTTTEGHYNHMYIHLALPWLLEGAIRGSVRCIMILIGEYYLDRAEPNRNADVLIDYWGKILNNTDTRLPNLSHNLAALSVLKHRLGRTCIICSKTDTKILTLKQCIGCSFYCYCSETCQITHWEEHNHRGECKQLRILNKYHKPYAKAIRDAAIRGDIHPALEKLQYKLGLTRPLEDYQELIDYNTHDGKLINPKDYVVAREDGTVWVGSIPSSPIGTS
ncbi:hypothetical protein FRACYDRAFT_228189 [Fragilariopsis cylindrus CCMP1102]|uniref:MYND-type domain-containing protein n=1 Tax=Fragilariopsis cylindrus CCMP1102 TaxID=635003 RepID=A0A1E7EXC5_9STRA|nr:hypothetical protein FRACYDRAFT_228189 [Fragilariopsis cylindrus CCMP1102]|eukprot:OEU10690.1 hypothetical protein FRACYDRAFT_228189 [Fragilariopsis cylindrus CCMP1102]